MININKKYRTRDGQEVRIYATDGGGPYMVHGAIRLPNFWSPTNWDENGLYKAGGFVLHDYDLIEVRSRHKRTVWLNVYDRHTFLYESREDADCMRDDDRIACIKVDLDFEEGEGL